ncbi:putative BUD22 [Lyophyllum shimeji]|uniref:BUD22 n=1 Tax=Lyophyllum shimeji TaxID=47721 RepID=A0A9P3UNZ3_LYOSH|nr:putative BUD22 [Lyophyllum shimeji]
MEATTSHHGNKRKRYEPPPQDLGAKIGGKLHHALKEVKKAAKKAKIFETQKLIKRLKNIQKKTGSCDEITEVEGQLELLKGLNHELIATTALKTKLNKVRILHDNEHIQAGISNELTAIIIPAAPGTAAAKVQSRLLSSKTLSSEIAAVVEDLKNVIDPKATTIDVSIADDESTSERPKKMKKMDTVKEKIPRPSQSVEGPPGTAEEEGSEDEELDDAGWRSGTVEGGDQESQDGWESGTVDDDGEQKQLDGWESGSLPDEDEDASAAESDDDEKERMVAPPSSKKALLSKAPPTKALAKSSGVQSTFLPSLSVGFTRGESDDSDLSESEVKVADLDIKKNRRGQRARRAIWEKKYGRNANHKKKEAESKKEALGAGSQRRAPVNGKQSFNRPSMNGGSTRPSDTKTVPQHRQEADKGWGQRAASSQGSAPQRSGPPARSSVGGRTEEKSLHPSWEAKRKLKEKESATIVPSQGKKIKFS